MSENFTLSCWVRGTPTSDILEIEVLPTQKVGSLQKLIKELQPDTFQDVHATAIRVYKPKDPVPEPHDESLRSVVLSDLGKPLSSLRQLSQEFVWPLAEDHIHIIVDAPCPDIVCWLRGANAENDFGGRIQSNATVSTLKEYIKEWNSELSDVPITRMKLFRISGDEEELQECLDSQGVGEFIKWNQLVSTCFADIPVLDSYCLVVEVSSPASQRSANRSGVGDSIKEARETYLRDVSKLPTGKGSPSAGSRPPSFRTRQRDLKTQIRCGRPRHPEETIPATLLHPVFGQFLDDSQTHVMTKEDNDFIEELANVMSDVYDTEQERVTKVYNVFRSHDINFNLGERVDGTDYVIDGAMSLDGHRYVIADFKNEAAASSSEPYMQCAAY